MTDLVRGVDLINGRPLPDTEDEPVRQLTERLLLDLGYGKRDILVDATRRVTVEGKELSVPADLLVMSRGRAAMVLYCRRGSLTTRERMAVAVARLVDDYTVPLAVLTNSEDAELLDACNGEILEHGLAAIPGPEFLARITANIQPIKTPPRQLKQAARIFSAYATLQCHWQCE